jgi:hypothetical protein
VLPLTHRLPLPFRLLAREREIARPAAPRKRSATSSTSFQRDDGNRAATRFVDIETHDPRFPHKRMLHVVDADLSADRDFGTS